MTFFWSLEEGEADKQLKTEGDIEYMSPYAKELLENLKVKFPLRQIYPFYKGNDIIMEFFVEDMDRAYYTFYDDISDLPDIPHPRKRVGIYFSDGSPRLLKLLVNPQQGDLQTFMQKRFPK